MRIPIRLLMISVLVLSVSSCVQIKKEDVSAQRSQAIKDRTIVDAAIEGVVSNGAFPFLYVRVEKLDGSLAYEHSAINPKLVSQIPTGDSWMRIWSMSKSVTIATILSLEEDGVLNRKDSVTDYIPEFADLMVLKSDADDVSCAEDLRAPARAMTIEDLLNHNDGFYYPFTNIPCLDDAMRSARLPEASSTDDLINRIVRLPLHPGGVGDHQYGIGTTILGLVAERATGKAFDKIVEANITGPLEISETLRYTLPAGISSYPRITGVDGALRPAKESELDIFGDSLPQYKPDTNIFLGGEGMVGTTKSFAKFLRLMGNMGELDGVRLLDESTVLDWFSPKTLLESPYGHNGFNIWVTSGKFDKLPNQKPGMLVGGGYEGTAFWIDMEAGYVGLIMSQVHSAATNGVDEVTRIRGIIYDHYLEPELSR